MSASPPQDRIAGLGAPPVQGRLAEAAGAHDHAVAFYDSEAFWADCVVRFVAPGLRDGDRAVVVQTPGHLAALETALADWGVAADTATARGQLIAVDAEDCLARFMVGGAPEPARFRETVGSLLDRAAAGGCGVRVHGEMVAVLWERGEVAAAIALEDLWNDLIAARPFTLLCTYPMCAFEGEGATDGFRTVCHQHAVVVPSETYSELDGADERHRMGALLQQEALADINARIALRRRQHALDEELRCTRELARLRDELIATVRDGLRPAARAHRGRSRTLETFSKTVVRSMPKTVDGIACELEPAGDRPGGPLPHLTVGDIPADEAGQSLAVPIVAGGGTYGLLRVTERSGHHLTTEEEAFVRTAAELIGTATELLAPAVDHDRLIRLAPVEHALTLARSTEAIVELVQRGVRTLGADTAMVALLADGGEEVELLTATSQSVKRVRLDDVQVLGQAVATGQRAMLGPSDPGAPGPSGAVAAAFPLGTEPVLGAVVTLWSSEETAPPRSELDVVERLADAAAVRLREIKDREATQRYTEQLEQALESRVVIEQAKGIVAERHAIGVEEAFQRLRTYVRDHNERLHDAAGRIVRDDFDTTLL